MTRREKMLRAVIALMLVAVLSSVCCAVHFHDAAIYQEADEFLWTGGELPGGSTVSCTFYQRAEDSTEWTLVTGQWSRVSGSNVYDIDTAGPEYTAAEELPWAYPSLPILLANTLPEDGTPMWFRVDVDAWIDGELYQYSCITTEAYWMGKVSIICGARPR